MSIGFDRYMAHELATRAVAANEAWANQMMNRLPELVEAEIRRGQPREDLGDDWDSFAEELAEEDRRLARQPWLELARREMRAFGVPTKWTLARLRELHLRVTSRGPLRVTASPRPREHRRRAACRSRGDPDREADPDSLAASSRAAVA
jgi:hypothetical protein